MPPTTKGAAGWSVGREDEGGPTEFERDRRGETLTQSTVVLGDGGGARGWLGCFELGHELDCVSIDGHAPQTAHE